VNEGSVVGQDMASGISEGKERTCERCGRPLRPRQRRWDRETCRVAAWYERRAVRQRLPPGLDVAVRPGTSGTFTGSQGIAVLRSLCVCWDRAVDTLALVLPNHSWCRPSVGQGSIGASGSVGLSRSERSAGGETLMLESKDADHPRAAGGGRETPASS